MQKQIANRFASRLEEVIKATQDLHKVLGECITSCNFEVVSPAWHTFRHGLNGGYLWTDDCIRQRGGLLWDGCWAEEQKGVGIIKEETVGFAQSKGAFAFRADCNSTSLAILKFAMRILIYCPFELRCVLMKLEFMSKWGNSINLLSRAGDIHNKAGSVRRTSNMDSKIKLRSQK